MLNKFHIFVCFGFCLNIIVAIILFYINHFGFWTAKCNVWIALLYIYLSRSGRIRFVYCVSSSLSFNLNKRPFCLRYTFIPFNKLQVHLVFVCIKCNFIWTALAICFGCIECGFARKASLQIVFCTKFDLECEQKQILWTQTIIHQNIRFYILVLQEMHVPLNKRNPKEVDSAKKK